MEVESTDETEQMEDESCLRMKIEELKRISIQDKFSLDLLYSELELSKLTSSQEITKCRNEYMLLKETMARLESDRNALKENELNNQEMILSLYKKIHDNEREFSERVLELNVQNSNLEHSKRKIDDEVKKLMKGCEALERNCNVKAVGDKNKIGEDVRKKLDNSRSENCLDNDLTPLSTLLSRKKRTKLAKKKRASYNVCNFRNFENNQKSPTSKHKLLDSDMKVQSYIKRNIHSKRAYTGRIASSDQIAKAIKRAKEIQKNLSSENPSCIKAMVPSNVSGAFWLSIPGSFKKNLPDGETIMILEGESGLEFNVKYIDRMNGLSGGWGRFAMAHKLEVGDVLLFELTQPTKFKIHIIKAVQETSNYIPHTAAKECEAGNSGHIQAYNEAVTRWKRKPNCKRSMTQVQ